jgi:F420-dependent oxidoreductase-like protein
MKLGLALGPGTAQVRIDLEMVRRAEALGFDSVWTAEAYGADAVTTAAWVLANTRRIRVGTGIMQIQARTPAATAMTAATLDQLSGGRFILGLGASGPQVAEGWHGVAYGQPLERTREYVEIVRRALARRDPLEFRGKYYSIPLTGEGTTGQGRPLKSILHGNPALPIYLASISPGGLRCAAEIADGVMPLWVNPQRFDLIQPWLEQGFARAGGGKGLHNFDVVAGVAVVMGDDLEACRAPARAQLALYIGGMGSREKNFYNDYARRLGYEDAARRIQDLFLAGQRKEAAAAVPEQLIDDLFLVGPRGRIIERLAAWREAGAKRWIDTLTLATAQPEVLELLAEQLL